ncbi:MAG: YbjQ family protein [Bdellovibrionales bacterium]
MYDLIFIVVVLFVTYITGSAIERRHFKKLMERERILMQQPYISDQARNEDFSDAERVELVIGSCVIAADRFKVFFGGLISIFGGKISAYESLTDRARREAILRMRESAKNADAVVCTRLQFSELGASRGGQVEAIAYGTAIYRGNSGATRPGNSGSNDEELQTYAF